MPPKVRSSKACTECRQAKLRCNSRSSFPDPCSRCKSRNLCCTFEPGFKRMPTKQRLEKVTRELNDLQSALGILPGSDSLSRLQIPRPHSIPASSADGIPCSDLRGTQDSRVAMQSEFFFGLTSGTSFDQIYRLGSFHLTAEQVRALLLSYARFQYKHLPVVDTTRSYHELYDSTPFLFWTLIVVAIRGSTAESSMLDPIRRPYNQYLAQVIIQNPMSLSTIQALLLISLWPFPIPRQREDPSWTLCNVAMSSLSSLKSQSTYRKAGNAQDRSRETEQAYHRTWLASFQVHTWLCSNMFAKPTLQHTKDSLHVALNTPDRLGNFDAHIEIQRQVAKYTIFLNSDENISKSTSAIGMFEEALSSIPTRFNDYWTKETDFALLVARLNLYSLALLATGHEPQSTTSAAFDDLDDLRMFLIKGFHSAIKLIALYVQMMKAFTPAPSTTNESQPLIQPTYWAFPKYYHFAFARAAFWLVRYVMPKGSNFTELDRDVGRNHVRLAHEHFCRRSRRPDDEPGNAAAVIETLIQNEQTLSSFLSTNTSATHDDSESVRDTVRRGAGLDGHAHGADQGIREMPAFRLGDTPDEHWLPPYVDMPGDLWDIYPYQDPVEPMLSTYDSSWHATVAVDGFRGG